MYILVALLFAGSLFAAQQDFNWRGAVATGQTVEIKGINGSIRALESNGKEVEVAADKHGRHHSPDEVQIAVVPHAGGVTICAVYPSSDGHPNECKPGKEGRNNVRNNDVVVEFTVRVPHGVHFTANTVNGAVEAKAIDGDVRAHTVNGKITVNARGNVQADTVNGSIQASMGNTSWTGKREFSTVNGGITLDLPAAASAELKASTVNGSITSDFPVTVRGKLSNRHLDATLGAGGRELRLSTVNGSIQLHQINF